MSERYLKQVIVVRKDLSMPAGKLAAMVAHASMTFLLPKHALSADHLTMSLAPQFPTLTADQIRWLTELDPGIEGTGQVSMAKIVVAVSDESELRAVEQKAKDAGLTVHRVIDSGYSHNKVGDFVCIAIGPDWPENLDPVTKTLRVYR